MKNVILVASMVLILVSCGTTKPPKNLDNACAIKEDRASWYRSLTKTEKKYGIPKYVLMSTMYHESKFDGKARPPKKYKFGFIPDGHISSAYGFSQALDGTWDWYKESTGKQWARRDRFKDAVDFMGWYMDRSHDMLGISKYDAYSQYLAYHEGQGGYRNRSYLKKRWLMNYARKVESKAAKYRAQLNSCP